MSHTQISKQPSAARLRHRWKQVDRTGRRQLIVESALMLLHHRGLDAVTMRQVARLLGVGAMTLYTYIGGQTELHREMIRAGFRMLQQGCEAAGTAQTNQVWRGGAHAYIRFALNHPNLYKLMFDLPTPANKSERLLLRSDFDPLAEKVRQRLSARGLEGRELERQSRVAAGRYWIALHGLASLAIAGRLDVLEGDLEGLLDDLLTRIAPD